MSILEKKVLDTTTSEVSADTEKVQIKRDFAPHRRVSHRICKECGRMYQLTDNDAVYYINKYGSLPLRCPTCREKNRTTDSVSKD